MTSVGSSFDTFQGYLDLNIRSHESQHDEASKILRALCHCDEMSLTVSFLIDVSMAPLFCCRGHNVWLLSDGREERREGRGEL